MALSQQVVDKWWHYGLKQVVDILGAVMPLTSYNVVNYIENSTMMVVVHGLC